MTTTSPDTQTSNPAPAARYRLRAATLAALTTATVVAALLLATTSANAATGRKQAKPFVAPTSVTLIDGVTCTPHADGSWDVTARFKVTGGRYLNLGNPADGASTNAPRDTVRGGTRYIESTEHFTGFPGYVDDHSIPITYSFAYQHRVAPVATKAQGVNLRSMRVLTRDFEVTFTCP